MIWKLLQCIFYLENTIFEKLYSIISFKRKNNDLKVICEKNFVCTSEDVNILFVMNHCWNLADAYLPVLVWLKEHYKNIKIIGVLYGMNAGINMKKEKFLWKNMKEIMDCIIVNDYSPLEIRTSENKIKKFILHLKKIEEINRKSAQLPSSLKLIFNEKIQDINFILKGTDSDDKVLQFVHEYFPNAINMIHPHGGYLAVNHEKRMPQCYFDYYLLINRKDLKYSCNDIEKKIIEIGSPRYDKWWRKRLLQADELKKLQFKLNNKEKVILCIFGELGDDYRISKIKFNEFISVVSEILNKNKSYQLIVKLHPKNNPDDFERYLRGIDGEQVYFSTLQLMQLSAISDLVLVPGISTGIIDAIISGKPTIEYGTTSEEVCLTRFKDKNGQYVSFSKHYNICKVIDDKEKLLNEICNILNNKYEDGLYSIENVINLENNASKNFADIIISLQK